MATQLIVTIKGGLIENILTDSPLPVDAQCIHLEEPDAEEGSEEEFEWRESIQQLADLVDTGTVRDIWLTPNGDHDPGREDLTGCCPKCGEACEDGGSLTVEHPECNQRCTCANGHSWYDTYTLTSQELVEEGDDRG